MEIQMKLNKETLKRIIKEELDNVLNETMYSPTNEIDMLIGRVQDSKLTPKQKENLIGLLQGPPKDVAQGKELVYSLDSVDTEFDELDTKLMSKEYESHFNQERMPENILKNRISSLIGHIMETGYSRDAKNYFTVSNYRTDYPMDYTFHPERIMNAVIKVPAMQVGLEGEEDNVKEAYDILMATGEFTSEIAPGTHYVGDDETFMARLKTIPTEREEEDAANRYLKKTFNRPDHSHTGFKGTTGERLAADRDAAYMKKIMSKLKNRT